MSVCVFIRSFSTWKVSWRNFFPHCNHHLPHHSPQLVGCHGLDRVDLACLLLGAVGEEETSRPALGSTRWILDKWLSWYIFALVLLNRFRMIPCSGSHGRNQGGFQFIWYWRYLATCVLYCLHSPIYYVYSHTCFQRVICIHVRWPHTFFFLTGKGNIDVRELKAAFRWYKIMFLFFLSFSFLFFSFSIFPDIRFWNPKRTIYYRAFSSGVTGVSLNHFICFYRALGFQVKKAEIRQMFIDMDKELSSANVTFDEFIEMVISGHLTSH